jgi:uncharacterized alkaline shock family protein YloU
MSEFTSSIFGRPKNDMPASGGYVPASTTAQTDTVGSGTTDVVVAHVVDTKATEVDQIETVESTGDASETESAADVETAEEKSDEAATDEDIESDDAPVVVAAGTRPAAGSRGNTTVGDGVLAKVVNMVVRKADGVHCLDEEGTSVELDGDVATIKVSLVVEFGHPVKALGERIRIDVIDAVEPFLGLDVAAVDVHVTDVHLPDAL